MNLHLSDEALALGSVVASVIDRAGGDQLARDLEADPESRHDCVDVLLAALGIWDLAPRTDPLELEAAAEVCRVTGASAMPYPVAERLARLDDGNHGVVVVHGKRPRANIADLPLRFTAVTLDEQCASLTPVGARLGSKLGHFVVDVKTGAWQPATTDAASLPLVLSCWTLLGMLERALALTCVHVTEREQFGRTLSQFQGVQFQLTDAAVAVQGLEALAKYSLWSLHADPLNARVDAVALRAAAISAADVVFRISHQLHGATGFCDEHPLSWLSRYSQPIRRLPLSAAETDLVLLGLVEAHGLPGLFDPESARYATTMIISGPPVR